MMNITLGNEEEPNEPNRIEERKSEHDEDDEDYGNEWVNSQMNADRIIAFEPLENRQNVSPHFHTPSEASNQNEISGTPNIDSLLR